MKMTYAFLCVVDVMVCKSDFIAATGAGHIDLGVRKLRVDQEMLGIENTGQWFSP